MIDLSPSTIFLCDFDGTIASVGLSDYLYRTFAACGMKYSDLWAAGKISTREEIESSFKTITASREEMESALAAIQIDPCFPEFIQFCREKGCPVAILSDGLDWAINFVLERGGVSGLPLYSNRIRFTEDGFEFEFPYYDPGTPLYGVGKRKVVEQFRDAGSKVVLVGDGRTDMEAAEVADYVIASNELLSYCRERGIPHLPYRNFCEITSQLRHIGG